MNNKFTNQIAFIRQVFSKTNFSLYIVGGTVRDMLLKIPPKDIDMATDAKPDQIVNMFKDYNVKINTVGKSFLVVKIDDIDIATFRKDTYDKGSKKPTTIPLATIYEDLSRRDFTINALAINCKRTDDKKLIDPFGGKNDLKNQCIKFVGKPLNRIEEDPLRMLRACRFASLLSNGYIDIITSESIKYNHEKMKFVARERIRDELMNSLKYNYPSRYIDFLLETKLLNYVLPSLIPCVGHFHGIHHSECIYTHSKLSCNNIHKKYQLLRLAALLHDVGKPSAYMYNENGTFVGHEIHSSVMVKDEMKSLKFSKKEIEYVDFLVLHHMRDISSKKSAKKLNKLFKENGFDWRDFLRLKIADRKANLSKNNFKISEIKNIIKMIKEENRNPCVFKDLNINGTEVMMVTGLNQGKKVGAVLKYLLESVMEDKIENDNAVLKRTAKILVERNYV